MHEGELRRTAREHFGKQIPTWIWRLLRADGYFDEDAEEDPEFGLRRIRQLLQIGPSAARPTTPKPSPKPRFTAGELLRAHASSDYAAKAAEQFVEVRRFREDILGDDLLSDDEAERFLLSQAARMFHPYEFKLAGLPLARHHSEVVHERSEHPRLFEADVRVDPPGTVLKFRRDPVPEVPWLEGRPLGEASFLIGFPSGPTEIWYWNDSVIHALLQVVNSLVERHGYPWNAVQAMWFVLTGEVPFVAPLKGGFNTRVGSHGNRVTVTMTIEPWVSAETVLGFYRDYQRRLLDRHNRPLSGRHLSAGGPGQHRRDRPGHRPRPVEL